MRTEERLGHSRGHDSMVTPESSMFGTRSPRPEGAGRHLLVVLMVSVLALGVAILFAERDVEPKSTPNKTRKKAASK
ncbi:MAG: hypothetical protein GY822_12645 [Deltaproteobacteria bacterium]|nr:hypothetical protein [Deltaproteobacteria bacterium]